MVLYFGTPVSMPLGKASPFIVEPCWSQRDKRLLFWSPVCVRETYLQCGETKYSHCYTSSALAVTFLGSFNVGIAFQISIPSVLPSWTRNPLVLKISKHSKTPSQKEDSQARILKSWWERSENPCSFNWLMFSHVMLMALHLPLPAQQTWFCMMRNLQETRVVRFSDNWSPNSHISQFFRSSLIRSWLPMWM